MCCGCHTVVIVAFIGATLAGEPRFASHLRGTRTLLEPRNAICLVIDGWQAGFAGPYGNSWINTPALNRLASEAFLFDQAFVDSPRLDRLYRSFWLGAHAGVPNDRLHWRSGIAQRLSRAGVATTLVTDESRVADHPLAAEFREIVRLGGPVPDEAALDINETRLAELFSQVLERVEKAREPFLLWAHTGSLATCWDAPGEFRQRYLEGESGDVGDDAEHFAAEAAALARVGISPPKGRLASMVDPDDLLALRRAYAAQISVLDACLAGLLEACEQLQSAERTLLFVAGARGFPLGEHGRVGCEISAHAAAGDAPSDGQAALAGDSGDALYNELIHVPWIWRLPDKRGALGRSSALVQPADCAATLADWWQLPGDIDASASELGAAAGRSVLPLICEETPAWRDRVLLMLDHERALRTASWYLRLGGHESSGTAGNPSPAAGELYVKPDDRWERNEISARCEEIAATMAQLTDECHRSIATGEPREPTPLSAAVQAGVS